MPDKKEQYELDVADDLMAAALAAVDARFGKKEPDDQQMEAFSEDLLIDEDSGDDDVGIEVELDSGDLDAGEEEEEGAARSSYADDDPDYEHTDHDELAFLHKECDRLTLAQQASEEESQAMKAQLEAALAQLRNQMARTERTRDKMRRLNSDATNALEAREAAEARSQALKQTVEKLQADLQRSLERRRRDLKDQRDQDTSKIVSSMLPVVDHLQLALQHAEANPETLIQGVQMVMGQFIKSLAMHGVLPIPSNPGSPFDPHLHEAIEMVQDPDFSANTVVSTAQVGYQYNGKLIRAARVVVARESDSPSDEEDPFAEDEGSLNDELEEIEGFDAPDPAADDEPEADDVPPPVEGAIATPADESEVPEE